MNYWVIKSDPEEYGWPELMKDKKTTWTGVRAYAARNHLRNMKKGDLALFYHSGGMSSITGIAKITREFFQDPTTDEEAWVAVELAPVKALNDEVTLAEIKKTRELKDMLLLKISRLSVMPVTEAEFNKILEMGNSSV